MAPRTRVGARGDRRHKRALNSPTPVAARFRRDSREPQLSHLRDCVARPLARVPRVPIAAVGLLVGAHRRHVVDQHVAEFELANRPHCLAEVVVNTPACMPKSLAHDRGKNTVLLGAPS